ncbi:MAG: S8 family serine peptidase [Burkholderiales bacterium]|nr:S8 family serine peptidase [Burkholderiales bacterium]
MKRWLACILLLISIGQVLADEPTSMQDEPSTDRQILVMIRLAPEHFRPNSSYGGSYGRSMGRAERTRTASALAHAYHLAIVNDWPMPLVGVDCFVMQVPKGDSIPAVLKALAADTRVEWAQPMQVFDALGGSGTVPGHNDPLFAAQPAASAWHLARLHQMTTGRQVTVAIVDSGVEATHPDLAGQVSHNEDFVDGRPVVAEKHGTAVAGIVAAIADNGIGIVGIAPNARLLALRACWQASPESTRCNSLSLAKALDYAIRHDADVINLSLSGPPDLLLARLLNVALARDIRVVAAIDPAQAGGGFPASLQGVTAVSDDAHVTAPTGAMHAPGRDIPATTPGGVYQLVSGTSFAAAQVSGLYALMRELERDGSTPRAIKAALTGQGVGHPDTCAAFAQMTGACVCNCPDPQLADTSKH